MINLEQIKLLETKVANAIGYIERLSKENADLHQKEAEQQAKLGNYQKQIDELEVLIMRFKEDQSKVEDAILAALDRFNQFEEAIEKSLRDKPAGTKAASKEKSKPQQAEIQHIQAETAAGAPPSPLDASASLDAANSGDGKICFEIPVSSAEIDDDIADPLDNTLEPLNAADGSPEKSGELDIF